MKRLSLFLIILLTMILVINAQDDPSEVPTPETVTLAGSFQAALGCSEDWQPPCENTFMTYDGDADVWRATLDLPAGNYMYKVALNGSWDANYGLDCTWFGANIELPVAIDSSVEFEYDHKTGCVMDSVNKALLAASPFDIKKASAYWVLENTLAWLPKELEAAQYQLIYSPDGALVLSGQELQGDYQVIDLVALEDGLPDEVLEKFPHLALQKAFMIPEESLSEVPMILKGQFALVALDEAGLVNDASALQIPGVLDDLYTYDGELGVQLVDGIPHLSVWAPTAKQVNLLLFADAEVKTEPQTLAMDYDATSGVWSIEGSADWLGQYYQYEVTVYVPASGTFEVNQVTDPYSISLSKNSIRSQIVDLNDPSLMPEGWAELEKPELEAPEDIVIYELHIRDFSVNDATVPDELKGTFLAFTLADSAGMKHLRALAEAGLTHLHLLPLFDIATINESKTRWRYPDVDVMMAAAPDSEIQQAELYPIRDLDPFNWGYDPYHYNVPEGSYSTDPDTDIRILEFREMVAALNQAGLRVVMDVVYNHTNASGQAAKSVLDQIVPGYYHRLDKNGNVESSTCCANTATEHHMMRKLMIDSVLQWAVAYKVDAFRFDLMGHHMLADMIALREALDALSMEADGVDGQSIYIYGEGWDFGEVLANKRGVNATQLNIAGTGIGVFNDRLRDAARGGNPFGDYQVQGFLTGLYDDLNGITPGSEAEQLEKLLLLTDQIRVGLAANLADYAFETASGEVLTGAEIDYNGAPAGYTADPQENIVYISAHDNETLFDAIQYKAAATTSMEERARMQQLGISLVGFSQGVPFYHAGIDMLRSKSFDKDSYNSNDWFNRLDFTYQTNNFGVGLPPAAKNESQWPIQAPLLADPDLQVSPELILATANHMQEVLQIRKSSPLFRLQTGEEVQKMVTFLNTGPEQMPGLIVMRLNDGLADMPQHDTQWQEIIVLFNMRQDAQDFSAELFVDGAYELHPIQQHSLDLRLQEAGFDSETGTFTVPGRTAAVFVLPRS
ncbi:pullulanase-type alpha-1,6-glucosidase [Anaerolineales bacterium]